MPNTQVDEVLTEPFLGHIRVATVFVIHVFAQPVKDDGEFAFALEEMNAERKRSSESKCIHEHF